MNYLRAVPTNVPRFVAYRSACHFTDGLMGHQPAQTKPKKREVRVWVNTRSGVYLCPGSRWYGKTKQGKFMGGVPGSESR